MACQSQGRAQQAVHYAVQQAHRTCRVQDARYPNHPVRSPMRLSKLNTAMSNAPACESACMRDDHASVGYGCAPLSQNTLLSRGGRRGGEGGAHSISCKSGASDSETWQRQELRNSWLGDSETRGLTDVAEAEVALVGVVGPALPLRYNRQLGAVQWAAHTCPACLHAHRCDASSPPHSHSRSHSDSP